MSEEQLKEAIQYNLDYLEGNIDFELEYKELAESYSKLYEVLQQKENIIKEVREYIEKHTENIDRGRYYEDYVETYPILEILDKENKE